MCLGRKVAVVSSNSLTVSYPSRTPRTIDKEVPRVGSVRVRTFSYITGQVESVQVMSDRATAVGYLVVLYVKGSSMWLG